MPITYLYFYFILGIVAVIYYLCPNILRRIVLMIASLLLYIVFAGRQAMLLMACSVLAAYIGARGITYFKSKSRKQLCTLCFWLAVGVIVGILGWHNYFNFIFENLNYIVAKLGINVRLTLIQAISPLGISFYSLSLISYLADVYWGLQEAEKDIGKVIFFGCYFPVVTTGPILRYNKFYEGINFGKKISYENICFSLQRILWGIFKKAVIADYFHIIVQEVFKNFSCYSGKIVLGAAYVSAVQLYLNFSASIDIVLGISQLFDIKLPENFDHPFASCTITELFRKWHISFGNWLKDYIYYPLMKSSPIQGLKDRIREKIGKKASKKTSTFTAMLVMWLLNGIWHGAKWKYIVGVGVLLWFTMLLEDLFEPCRVKIVSKLKISEDSKTYLAVRRFMMYTKFSFMMIFFSADGVAHGLQIIIHILSKFFVKSDFSFLTDLGFPVERLIILLAAFGLYLYVSHLSSKVDVRKWLSGKKIWVRWTAYYLIILSILIFSANGKDVMEEFIYAQF